MMDEKKAVVPLNIIIFRPWESGQCDYIAYGPSERPPRCITLFYLYMHLY
jgi:hypothetical protein